MHDTTMLLSYCPRCKIIFQTQGISMNNASGISFSGSFSSCIRCGGLANVLDGVYEATDGVISLMSAPSITLDMHRRFAELVMQARRQALEPAEFEKKAEEIAPEFAKAARIVNASSSRVIMIALLLIWLKGCTTEAKLDVNQLVNQAGTAIEWLLEDEADNAKGDHGTGNRKPTGESPGVEDDDITIVRSNFLERRNHLLLSSTSGFSFKKPS